MTDYWMLVDIALLVLGVIFLIVGDYRKKVQDYLFEAAACFSGIILIGSAITSELLRWWIGYAHIS